MPNPLLVQAVAALVLWSSAAVAEAPRVVVDTAPLHALVARVMAGVGAPALLLTPGTSPHDFALRPSDAARLAGAEVLIWTGPALAPWLAEAAETLAPGAARLSLLDAPGWSALPRRDDPAFDTSGGAAHVGHTGAGQAEADAPIDPHAWLDPTVAADWGDMIASHLAAADPEDAALYAANAAALRADLMTLDAAIAARLDGLSGTYLVAHDAFQYFEVRYGRPAAGAIALSDAAAPGLARLAATRDLAVAGGVTCILTDPETGAYAAQLTEGTAVRLATADPDAVLLTPGPDLYPNMMRGLADALAGCLEG